MFSVTDALIVFIDCLKHMVLCSGLSVHLPIKVSFQPRTGQINSNLRNGELIGHNEVSMFRLCANCWADISFIRSSINEISYQTSFAFCPNYVSISISYLCFPVCRHSMNKLYINGMYNVAVLYFCWENKTPELKLAFYSWGLHSKYHLTLSHFHSDEVINSAMAS